MSNSFGNHKYKSLLTNTLIFALGTIGSKLIMFLLLPLYTNTLSSEEYGVADLVFTSSEILQPFISLAILNGLLRFGASENYRKEDVLHCATVVFCIGSVVSVVVAPAFQLYTAVAPWKWYLAAYAIAVFASKNVLIYLKVSNQNKLYSTLSIFQAFLLAVTNILMLLILKRGVEGYLVANVLAHLGTAGLGFLLGGLHRALLISQYDGQLMKEMILYSSPFIANDIAWWVIHSADKVMLEVMVGASILGIYTVASKLPLLVNVFSGIFGQAWVLSVVGEFENDNDKGYYDTVFRYYVTVIVGIGIALTAIVRPFFYVYLGVDFQSAWQYVPLLLIAACFSALDAFLISFFAAAKNSKSIMWPSIIGAVINVAVNALLIPHIGLWGAIAGTVLSYFSILVIHIAKMQKELEIDLPIAFLGKAFFIVTLQALLVGRGANILLVSGIAVVLYVVVARTELRSVASVGLIFLKKAMKKTKG